MISGPKLARALQYLGVRVALPEEDKMRYLLTPKKTIRKFIGYSLIGLAMLGISGVSGKVQADPVSVSDLVQSDADGNNTLAPNENSEAPYDWHSFLWIRANSDSDTIGISVYSDEIFGDAFHELKSGDYFRIKIPDCQEKDENRNWDYKLTATDILLYLTPTAPYPLDCILLPDHLYQTIVGTAGAGWNLVGIEKGPDQTGFINIIGEYSDIVLINYDLVTQISLQQGDEERLTSHGDLYVYFGKNPPLAPGQDEDEGDGPVIGPHDTHPGEDSIPDPDGPGLDTDDGGLIPPSVDLPDGEGTDPNFPDFDDKGITPDDPAGQAYHLTGGGCSLEAVPQSGSIFNLLILALFGMGGFLPRILKRK